MGPWDRGLVDSWTRASYILSTHILTLTSSRLCLSALQIASSARLKRTKGEKESGCHELDPSSVTVSLLITTQSTEYNGLYCPCVAVTHSISIWYPYCPLRFRSGQNSQARGKPTPFLSSYNDLCFPSEHYSAN